MIPVKIQVSSISQRDGVYFPVYFVLPSSEGQNRDLAKLIFIRVRYHIAIKLIWSKRNSLYLNENSKFVLIPTFVGWIANDETILLIPTLVLFSVFFFGWVRSIFSFLTIFMWEKNMLRTHPNYFGWCDYKNYAL